ncbi:MAG: hypothetical protein JWP87_6159, partial [Labilithrix sp.]|nr:hypothetical protein [Labilithrix sp.]
MKTPLFAAVASFAIAGLAMPAFAAPPNADAARKARLAPAAAPAAAAAAAQPA